MAVGERPLVKIVATGGTIANTRAGRIPVQQVIEEIRDRYPETAAVFDRVRLEVIDLIRVGSELFTSKEFLDIARTVNSAAQDFKVAGIIVTQGTFTTEETSYFLHLLAKTSKPIVITNSQRRHGTVSNDGDRNLVDSISVALAPEAAGKGALVVSNQTINSGREVLKTSSRPDAFVCGEHGILGVIENDGVTFYRAPIRRHTFNSEFDVTTIASLPKVEVVNAYYDADPGMIKAAAELGVRGIVLNGLTNRGTPHELQKPALEELTARGIPVVRTARGGVNNRVTVEAKDQLISGDNLPAHKARILLQLALTKTSDFKEIQRIFKEY
jgi:L-asparaginase type II